MEQGNCNWSERGGFHEPGCAHITNVHPHRCCGLAHACNGIDGCGAPAGKPCKFEGEQA